MDFKCAVLQAIFLGVIFCYIFVTDFASFSRPVGVKNRFASPIGNVVKPANQMRRIISFYKNKKDNFFSQNIAVVLFPMDFLGKEVIFISDRKSIKILHQLLTNTFISALVALPKSFTLRSDSYRQFKQKKNRRYKPIYKRFLIPNYFFAQISRRPAL